MRIRFYLPAFGLLLLILPVLAGCRAAVVAPAPAIAVVAPTTAADDTTTRPPVVSTGRPPSPTAAAPSPQPSPTGRGSATPSPQPSPTGRGSAVPSPQPSPTARGSDVPSPQPSPTGQGSATPTPNRDILCSERLADDGLLTVVTLTYGLSRDFEPRGLVPLSGYLSGDVTLGYPNELRHVAVGPLVRMIADMQAAGLHPFVISGYRSYSAQAIARQKWAEAEPERVNILSAPPGFSEHQLGTVVDFGSPELPEVVGQEDVEFHTYFYKTSEGLWLADNAHNYGFTLSYPFEAQETTGFFWEPWHYRYVGIEMATFLHEQGISLTEHQLATEPPPCIPDTP